MKPRLKVLNRTIGKSTHCRCRYDNTNDFDILEVRIHHKDQELVYTVDAKYLPKYKDSIHFHPSIASDGELQIRWDRDMEDYMKRKDDNISGVIEQLISELKDIDFGAHYNERYLHHRFSWLLQNKYKEYRISFSKECQFHPEWATCINGERGGGWYKEEEGQYYPRNDGGAGFIDFAVGNVKNPDSAIEFKMSNSFNREGVIYDYMKLLDKKNSITSSFSLVVYYGRAMHSINIEVENLNSCVNEALNRLGSRAFIKDDILRTHSFYVLELINDKNRTVNCFLCKNTKFFESYNP